MPSFPDKFGRDMDKIISNKWIYLKVPHGGKKGEIFLKTYLRHTSRTAPL